MAGTLLHITLAHRALEVAEISSRVKDELQRHIQDFRLGAVLVDLPYHERIVFSGLKLMLGFSLEYNVWGTLLHARSPANLALAFLKRAKDVTGRAIALGFLTHFAVDIVFHTEISRRVMNLADGSKGLDDLHKQIEDQIDLYIHNELIEHSGMGTPYARRMLALRPESSWPARVSAPIAEVHGNAPETAQFKRWQRELALYGLICSTDRVPWVTTITNDNSELQEAALGLAKESIRLAAEYIETGINYLDGRINRDGFLKNIPNRSLLDGGPASPSRSE
ncbi:MAG: zinc dependent phospholipase C family protein [Proteobacteria bacterium]|nr:zinc dependent phospholipase C family protein [Pseudomonadota bacterium]